MATKAKESALRKEKKVLPSSDSHTTHNLASSKKPAAARASSGSTTSGKAVPSYLKSAVNSRSDPPNLAKKPASHEDAAQKATLLRRRSFDKPPSASPPRTHRSFISPDPKERAASGVRVTARSSSLTPKTSTSPKPALDKTSKSPKPVKAQPPAATGRTLKGSTDLSRSRSLSNKKEIHASHSLKGPDKHDVSGDHDLESKQESNQEHERKQTVESEVQIPSDIPESKHKEHFDPVSTQVNNNVDEEHRPSDVSSVSKGQNVPETVQEEEAEGNLHEEGSKKLDDEEENHQPGEAAADEAKVVAQQETLEEEANDDAGSSEESEEEKKKEVGEQGNEAKEDAKSKEGLEAVEVATEEGKAEEAVTSNVSQKKQAGGQGKKESPAAYNNVIEETKKKLLEKKNSKVKALVGAFETVIDYESASK